VSGEKKKRIIKTIKVDLEKCMGCRSCELICAAFHSTPKYGTVNPGRSRIRVFRDTLNNVFLPVRAGAYARAECDGRQTYIINGQEYGECNFCNASCPSREWFKEPDSGLPLKCDMCEDDPDLKQPVCVEWCLVDALTYEEREEETEEVEKLDELELGLEALIDKYGLNSIVDTVARMSISENE
jgi:benzoyl-CoA reductase subunit BamC